MRLAATLCLGLLSVATATGCRKECPVKGSGTSDIDDAPAVREAFENCGNGGQVVFEDTTYYINSALNITGLKDVRIDVHGTLLFSTDIEYWLENSLDVGYQNQSTAFVLGGENIVVDGHGTGALDGNGDVWYQWIQEQENSSNYPGRPHGITFNSLTNSIIRGLSFFRSQMWTMSIIYSYNVELSDILVNNTGNIVESSNTDGANTIRSSNIHFSNWTVYNGDDSISVKANSTDITIENSKFYNGLGISLGSIGQYSGQYETIERIKIRSCNFDNTLHALYAKTWTDDANGYPPNGGGGGLGFAEDITAKDLTAVGLRGSPVAISQCTRFIGAPGDGNCTNSQFQIRDLTVENLSGTTESSRVASLQCSAVAPCTGIALVGVDLKFDNGTRAGEYLCGNVEEKRGFECTGKPCEAGSSTGEC